MARKAGRFGLRLTSDNRLLAAIAGFSGFPLQVRLGIADGKGIDHLRLGMLQAEQEDTHCLRLGTERPDYHVK